MIKTKKITSLRTPKGLSITLAIICLVTIFTGCKDDDDPIVETKPVITVTSPSDGASTISRDNIALTFNVKSDNGLKRVTVKFKSATGSEQTVFDTTFNNSQPESFDYNKNFMVGDVGTETYTISATDRKDNSESKSINIKSITGFSAEDFGTIFHTLGTKNGAYDLLKSEQKAISDNSADKDMENTNFAGEFNGAWISKNGTMFVKAPAFDINTGTINEAKILYAAGTPKVDVYTPKVNDIYVAKLRGTEVYTVIKVISIAPTNDECGCTNKGKITFSFKKSL